MSHVPGRIAARVLLGLLTFYRLAVTPWLAPRCRFAPSCSAYAAEAIATHGPWSGTWLAIRRLGRCHPWNPGGYDPVPFAPVASADDHARDCGCDASRR